MMWSRARIRLLLVVTLTALLFVPSRADAQWYFAGYFGANHTQSATVSIDQPSRASSLTFDRVTFSARPFVTPPYYGYRFGRLVGNDRRIGLEFEFIHLKVISETSLPVHISGQLGGVALNTTARMDTAVERYSMTHGLNFILFNLVTRTPIGGAGSAPGTLIARIGSGPTRPHGETTVGGLSQEQYEYAGFGVHAAAGVDLRLRTRLSAVIEYKVTFAKPTIAIVGGTGQMTALTHQLAVGLALGLSR